MDSLALIDSFSEFKDYKKIDRVTLTAILEEVFRTALKKKFGSDENFDIIVNPDKGDLQIWRNRVVVADGQVEDPMQEISLSEARRIQDDFEVGEDVTEEVKIADLGRRAILALRQNLVARIHEHDSNTVFNRFKALEGTLITGEIHHVRPKLVIVHDENQNEMILPREEQIPSDFYRKGEPLRALIKTVEMRAGKPTILLSRVDPLFLERLFEVEIPEVADGIIIVKKVVRIPGEKAKVAVESYDDRIDPVGACVGMKGSRIHGIVRELNNENIDVINYTTNLPLYITRALNPAKISNIEIDQQAAHVSVYVKPDEVSKAIGKSGQNIRLASQLIGMEIDIYRDTPEEEDVDLSEFSDEIESWVIEELQRIGCDTAKSVLELGREELLRRTDLEEETVDNVLRILSSEFEE